MKLISFDIGMKNLAFAVIEQNNSSKTILYWNVINLIKEQAHCYISSCKKDVYKSCLYHGRPVNMCERHLSFYDTLKKISNKLPNITSTDTDQPTTILTELTTVKTINCLNVPIDDLRMSLINKLDTVILPIVFKENIEKVVLESQPVFRNPRMKAIADSIYMWFLIRCKNDGQIVKTINYVSATNKLKKYAEELIFESESERYAATKNKAVFVVSEYLKNNTNDNNTKWLQVFNNYKKQDDLADCLLQGFYYLDNIKEIAEKNAAKATKKNNKNIKKNIKPIEDLSIGDNIDDISNKTTKKNNKKKIIKPIEDLSIVDNIEGNTATKRKHKKK